MTIHRTETYCPHCGRAATGAVNADDGGGPPRDGDLSICYGCLKPAMYAAGPFGLAQRPLTAAEEVSLAPLVERTTADCRAGVDRALRGEAT